MSGAWRSAAAACLLVSTAASAQQPSSSDSLFDAADRWVERGLRRYQIAGAALAIVRDGRVVHARGFGYADVARGYRVDPDTTEFHIASVTKLVTAIAALQQVDAGRLTLRGDVRPMLGTLASGWGDHAVTLHNLLTHTAGLDVRWSGIAVHRAADVRPLADYLPAAMPPAIDPPGTVVRYSNQGFAAVGRLVEIASGEPWATYVEQHVFRPIGMTRSYAKPRERPASHAVPYRYRRDTTPEPDVYEQVAPAGAVHSTVSDLGRLVASMLDSTSTMPVPPASKRSIITPTLDGAGIGFGYGTFQYPNRYAAAVSAGGEVPGFSTRLLLVPSLGLGVVLLVNRKDPTLAISVFDSVLARIAAVSTPAPPCGSPPATMGPTQDIHGRYRSNAYDHQSFLRIGALLGPTLTVGRDSGGSVVVVDPVDNTAGRWRQTGASTWAGRDGECLSIVAHDGNQSLLLSTKFAGPAMLERVSAFSNPGLVVPITAAAVLVLLLVLVVDLVTVLRAKHARPSSLADAPWLRMTIATLYAAFLVLFGVGLYRLAIGYDDRFAFGIPAWFVAVLLIPYLATALTVLLAVVLSRSRRAATSLRWRGWLTVLAGAQLSLVLYVWHATRW